MTLKMILVILCLMSISVSACDLPDTKAEEAQSHKPPQPASLVLIGESHAEYASTKLVYRLMQKARLSGKSVNFMYERDQERLNWARNELEILSEINPNLLNENSQYNFAFKYNYYNQYLQKKNSDLFQSIYSSWNPAEFKGKINNRFWILKILKEFPDQIVPVDPSFEEVKRYYAENKNELKFNSYQKLLFEVQPDKHKAMSTDVACHIRDLLLLKNTSREIKNDSINIMLVGLVHAGYIHQNSQSPMKRWRTFIREQDLSSESEQLGVMNFYQQAQQIEESNEEEIISHLLR